MKKIIYIALLLVLVLPGCHDDLDRDPRNEVHEKDYWREEAHVRYYANKFLPKFFPGYSTGYGTEYAPLKGYYFNDDVTVDGKQANFEDKIPSSRSGTAWMPSYTGPQWNFETVREINLMLSRLEEMYEERLLTEEAYRHWVGIGRFYRGLQTSKMVCVFGDMIYVDQLIDPYTTDPAIVYQDRKPRGEVMDKVYEDFKYAMGNVRTSSSYEDMDDNNVSRYVVASFISRAMLIEGSFQKYHSGLGTEAPARAEKYFKFAMEAADYVMSSDKYQISGDYRSLFTSTDLKSHREVIYSRTYSSTLSITHSVASASNTLEGQAYGANLSLIKSYICTDGKPWQNSAMTDAKKFDITSLIKTRDSRFEATFQNKATDKSVSYLYGTKFCPRDRMGQTSGDWSGSLNPSAAPVMRYSEVLLNWVEAKAELADMGILPLTQSDLDISVNAIRNRDLAKEAIDAGVQKTSPLVLASLPTDPDRDADVPSILWEIRRERRMEFVYEHSRIIDLRRWRKLEYMDNYNDKHKTYRLGLWVTKTELASKLSQSYIGKLSVVKDLANINAKTVYDGTNENDMTGFYVIYGADANPRDGFDPSHDRAYNAPIGENDINEYARRGYKLTQSKGWSSQ
ncbi:hypothetical protein M2451_001646 [Dysgonomonas sp. PFB1-18]|uniref:RagB/SusD family nutrient uptake outer membrane protein n=1 Tax=unclassified Dysgonomonas TaxID=2630389 RepID=UPI00247663A8|nr:MULTISPECIES: RagB/SusD family nutrient uptake outer membrane protein [unclassified Dysgonomonas]MDH6308896.1 hypothetical protein [Dysgonomonas sp. PF1-14]MDH6338647.1 hypothetical protein [Dysgonomonas sp. PF1-16]MDH6380325.1 hypothetical protein [Dysgonomonas sp. PFB1-18]MDH6397655.1 hypothetical protein [Dysgonomonas sp. PF1-23]